MTEVIKEIEGHTFKNVFQSDEKYNGDVLNFIREDGTVIKFLHYQDCCESVYLESITGDLSDLIDTPILLAEVRTDCPEPEGWGDSYEYTFYTFRTIKGTVDVRWNGSSNGYYSTSVTMNVVKPILEK